MRLRWSPHFRDDMRKPVPLYPIGLSAVEGAMPAEGSLERAAFDELSADERDNFADLHGIDLDELNPDVEQLTIMINLDCDRCAVVLDALGYADRADTMRAYAAADAEKWRIHRLQAEALEEKWQAEAERERRRLGNRLRRLIFRQSE